MTQRVVFSPDSTKYPQAISPILDAVEQTHGQILTPVIRAQMSETGVRLHVTLAPMRDGHAPNFNLGHVDLEFGVHDVEVIAREIRALIGEFLLDDISRV